MVKSPEDPDQHTSKAHDTGVELRTMWIRFSSCCVFNFACSKLAPSEQLSGGLLLSAVSGAHVTILFDDYNGVGLRKMSGPMMVILPTTGLKASGTSHALPPAC